MANENEKKIKSYTSDGETIVFESGKEQKERESWELAKKTAKNPLAQILRFKVHTQGAGR